MFPEHRVFFDSYNVIDIIRIVIPKIREYVKLYSRLMMESFLVPNNFYSDQLIRFVVKTLDSLTKASLPKKI